MVLRHMDGKRAIENVAPHEGMERKKVHVLFNAVREKDGLLS
jgi:hypothetical protein